MQLTGKNILVIGGTGSIGAELVKYLYAQSPSRLVVFSRTKSKQQQLSKYFSHNPIEFIPGDVRKYSDVYRAMEGIDIVFLLSAIKYVPLCEEFPSQALLTNCIGPMNVVNAIRNGNCTVEKLVYISTDKACDPVGVMGLTKALQEKIMTQANFSLPETDVVGVRFGNVISPLSEGSVFPLFCSQIEKGIPLTITDPEMTRFYYSMSQAVESMVDCVFLARQGQILLPKLRAFKLGHLVQALIESAHSGTVEVIGKRPGEKSHESMFSQYETGNIFSLSEKYFVLSPHSVPNILNLALYSSSETSVMPYKELKICMIEDDLI